MSAANQLPVFVSTLRQEETAGPHGEGPCAGTQGVCSYEAVLSVSSGFREYTDLTALTSIS